MNFSFRPMMLLAVSFLAVFSSAGPVCAADPPTQGLKELQGMWKLVWVESEGNTTNPVGGKPKLVIKDNKMIYGGLEIAELKVDVSTTPKVIDLEFHDPDRVLEGIFVVEKDTLKICLNRQTEGAKDRPGVFLTKDQSEWRLLVFEREKDAKSDPAEGLSGFVGLQLKSNENKEVMVVTPLKDSPADKAGFKQEDVILKVAGAAANDLMGTIKIVRKAKPGDKLEIQIRRDKEEKTITVKVGVLPFKYVAGLG